MQVEVRSLSKRFGGLQALDQVSLVALGSQVTAVIGPNGAGKSTLMDCLSGITPIDVGQVSIDGIVCTGRPLSDLVEIGITRTFQNIRLFESLDVIEHVILSRLAFTRCSRYEGPKSRSGIERDSMALLDRVGIGARARAKPGELSYGERRRLEIARGLAIEPRLFLLDEPAAGSTPGEQVALATLIKEIALGGAAVILVEHHMDLVGRVASKVVVLNFGRVIVTGTIGEVRNHPEVITAYLGSTHAA